MLDADTHVEEAHGVRESLRATHLDAALSSLIGPSGALDCKWRNLFRAVPGLAVRGHHAGYVTGDGRIMWNGHYGAAEPAVEVYLYMRHVPVRSPGRAAAKRVYEGRRQEVML